MARFDSLEKARGQAMYAADVALPGMLHAAITRSVMPHASIRSIDTTAAAACPGVVGVYTSEDVSDVLFGHGCRDMPILARGRVRFVGERVAAVVAETRRAAERGAALVNVDYEELPATFDPVEALDPAALPVHDAPWSYEGAANREGDPANLQAVVSTGDPEKTAVALAGSAHRVDCRYTTPGGHQGYLEPHACVATVDGDGRVHVWLSTKSPYEVRAQVAACLRRAPEDVELHPVMVGGDFGGKGTAMDSVLAAELARLTGRPVKSVMRFNEELTAGNPRHPSDVVVQAGCDEEGRLTGLSIKAFMNGGAYAGFKRLPGALGAFAFAADAYRVPAHAVQARLAYTNTVPRGPMRAPGGPQSNFAVESALDELAAAAGIDPVEFRNRNLRRSGEPDSAGASWQDLRTLELLDAVTRAYEPLPGPAGWPTGCGVAMAIHGNGSVPASLRMTPVEHRVRVDVSIPENGSGLHNVVHTSVVDALGMAAEDVEVRQVSTAELPTGFSVTGSRFTATMVHAVEECAKLWRARSVADEAVMVDLPMAPANQVAASCAQLVQVAVDTETGQVTILQVVTALDPSRIINPAAFRMQIEGGVAMGVGFACLEDLYEAEGQVWAANLGEFRIPSCRGAPPYRTIMLDPSPDSDTSVIKGIGELTTPPTAAAAANAVFAATGCRIRDLPITSEKVYRALRRRHELHGSKVIDTQMGRAST